MDTYRVLSEIPRWPIDTFPIKTAGAVSLISDSEGQDLIINTLCSGRSAQILEIIRQTMEVNDLTPKGEEELASCARGSLFERVSAQYINAGLGTREILLPIHEVFDAFSATFYDRKVIIDGFGLNRGIDGVFIPDGVIMERDKTTLIIRCFCEFSIDLRSLMEKARIYHSGRRCNGFKMSSHIERREILKRNLASLVRRKFPDLPGRVLFDSQFRGAVCVGPRIEDSRNGHSPNGEFDIEHVPITHDEFHRVVDGIIEDLSPLQASK